MLQHSVATGRPETASPTQAGAGRRKAGSNAARQQQLQDKGGAEVGAAEDGTEAAADRLAALVMQQVAAAPADDGAGADP